MLLNNHELFSSLNPQLFAQQTAWILHTIVAFINLHLYRLRGCSQSGTSIVPSHLRKCTMRKQSGMLSFTLSLTISLQKPIGSLQMHKPERYNSGGANSVQGCLPKWLYTFTIYDVNGDGIYCTYGLGLCSISLDDGIVKSGG